MILDLFKLDGRIALVTGASRGLGQSMADVVSTEWIYGRKQAFFSSR